jgi:hypothetical protein
MDWGPPVTGIGVSILPSLTDIEATTTGSTRACIWASDKVVSSLRRICVFLVCFFCWTVHLVFSVVIPLVCAKRPSPKWLLHAGDSVTVFPTAQSFPVPKTTSVVCGASPSASLLGIPRTAGLPPWLPWGWRGWLFGCVLANQRSS